MVSVSISSSWSRDEIRLVQTLMVMRVIELIVCSNNKFNSRNLLGKNSTIINGWNLN